MAVIKSAVMILVLLSLLAAMAANASSITCAQATTSLNPCITYLTEGNSSSTSNCCYGVRNIAANVPTTEDRRSICECLKNDAQQIQNLLLEHAAALPGLCAVHLPFAISPDIDCNRISV